MTKKKTLLSILLLFIVPAIFIMLWIFIEKNNIINPVAWAMYGFIFGLIELNLIEEIYPKKRTKKNEYLYDSFEEYNEIMGGKLHGKGYEIIWDMARTPKIHQDTK